MTQRRVGLPMRRQMRPAPRSRHILQDFALLNAIRAAHSRAPIISPQKSFRRQSSIGWRKRCHLISWRKSRHPRNPITSNLPPSARSSKAGSVFWKNSTQRLPARAPGRQWLPPDVLAPVPAARAVGESIRKPKTGRRSGRLGYLG
jgi:hypothetical protein